jgi:hypothetical protein
MRAYAMADAIKRPSIRIFSLADAGKALAEIAGRHVRGKLVVVP